MIIACLIFVFTVGFLVGFNLGLRRQKRTIHSRYGRPTQTASIRYRKREQI